MHVICVTVLIGQVLCEYMGNIGKQTTYHESMDSLNNITKTREFIRETAPRRKKRTTKIWRDFESAYDMDIKVTLIT